MTHDEHRITCGHIETLAAVIAGLLIQVRPVGNLGTYQSDAINLIHKIIGVEHAR